MSLSHSHIKRVDRLVVRESRMKEQEGELTQAFVTHTRNGPHLLFTAETKGTSSEIAIRRSLMEEKGKGRKPESASNVNKLDTLPNTASRRETKKWKRIETPQC